MSATKEELLKKINERIADGTLDPKKIDQYKKKPNTPKRKEAF